MFLQSLTASSSEKEMFATSSSQRPLVARGAEGLRWQPRSISMANWFGKSCLILFRSFRIKTLGRTKFVGPPKLKRGCVWVCERTVKPDLRNFSRKCKTVIGCHWSGFFSFRSLGLFVCRTMEPIVFVKCCQCLTPSTCS